MFSWSSHCNDLHFLTWPPRGENHSNQLQWKTFSEKDPNWLSLGYMPCPPLNQSLWLWARFSDQPSLGPMPSTEVRRIGLLLAGGNGTCINKSKRYLWPSATGRLSIARGNCNTVFVHYKFVIFSLRSLLMVCGPFAHLRVGFVHWFTGSRLRCFV